MKIVDKSVKISGAMLIAVFILVIFHAPISVFFSQFFTAEIVKSWKEIILLIVSLIVLLAVWRSGLIKKLRKDTLLGLILLYAVLHIILLTISTNDYQKAAGLAVDLRYLLFFVLVYCLVILWPSFRRNFLIAGVVSGAVSMLFAFLQATVLPKDILKYIGYSKETISPYLTIDRNQEFIRINGTFRGPNPLGVYVATFLSLVFAWVVCNIKQARKYKWIFIGISTIILVVLWASYSRSAWLAMVLSMLIIIFTKWGKKIKTREILIGFGLILALVFTFTFLKDTDFVQNTILHNNPAGGSSIDSNEEHADSIGESLKRFIIQPYGAGIGSTGSASLESDKPFIIENQYLFIAHESGWFGLGLFVSIYMLILGRLYKNKRDWLCLGVFASGIGLALVGLFLPVFADDTVSMIWFGLAAVALGSHIKFGAKNA